MVGYLLYRYSFRAKEKSCCQLMWSIDNNWILLELGSSCLWLAIYSIDIVWEQRKKAVVNWCGQLITAGYFWGWGQVVHG